MTHWSERHQVVPAVYAILRKGNQVLLARRFNTGYKDGEYSLPAGHLDGGETAAQAIVREIKEEVGVDVDSTDVTLALTMHRLAEEGDHERVDMFFEVSKWQGEPTNAEPDKCDEVRWVYLNELPDNVVDVIQFGFERIAEGKTYTDFNF